MTRSHSDKPFIEALDELLHEQDLSERELVRKTRAQSKWGSLGVVTRWRNDDIPPTVTAMKAVARALNVPPEHFAEYRLAQARANLDPAQVGITTALWNLAEIEAVLDQS